MSCNHVSTRESSLQTVDLAYPRKAADAGPFADVLRAAIVRSSSTKAACPSCKQFAPLDSKRDLAAAPERSLPPVLSVNAMVSSSEQQEIWRDRTEGGKPKRFLPLSVAFRRGPKGLVAENNGETGIIYDVKSLVVQVQTAPENPAHLLSFVRVADEQWVMFNDFLVRPVKQEEVFSFADWKVPAIIMLERRDSATLLDYGRLPKELDHEVLFKDQNMAYHRNTAALEAEVLTPDELPTPGTLISIDAEFVALQQEENEFRSDGTKKILRPSHMSLARVSVLRGPGEKEAVPFIDDYIHTKEAIADYLTEYSGIKAGDLDPNNSKHTLVPLKVAYKKLRLLVDLGCIFIGHGLSKDFRTISEPPLVPANPDIFVPPEQVLDTVNLYTIPGRSRKLSLRFLTWFLLKKEIQSKEHDSIEDARYAYLLYKKYRHFEDEGRFEDVMEDIFAEGHKTGFKPRSEADALRADTPTPGTPGVGTPTPSSPAPGAGPAGNGAFPPLQHLQQTRRPKLARGQWTPPAPAAPFVPGQGQRRW
jgi:PAB-dependent poly(A)-specific ribonuclease subunit 2